MLLKLIFHQCHANNFNPFKQIGLIGLYCLGEPVAMRRQAQPPQVLPAVGGGQLDPETAIQIQNLQQQKDQAVKDENFDLAKQVKESIDRLFAIGQQLTALEEQKRLAIEQEDFDSAKMLKVRIAELRNSAMVPQQPVLPSPMMSPMNMGAPQ